jgi:putative ABC transport system ATP-binding protein
MLEGRDLTLAYRDGGSEFRAVDGVSVTAGPGEFVGILGPSGSGKSSLLYLLAGLKRPDSGEVRWEGRALAGMDEDARSALRRERFGFVFQNHFLVPHLTALENVRAAGAPGGEGLLEELGIARCRDKLPWQMSAGERQRAAIARAVAHGPSVVFADEPTASLDRGSAGAVMDCLKRTAAGRTLIVVTHDESMLSGSTRILRMQAGRLA